MSQGVTMILLAEKTFNSSLNIPGVHPVPLILTH